MDQNPPRGKKFSVIKTGECGISYEDLVKRLVNIGLTEAKSRGDCDYYVVFCPISSRVGTNISEAERRIPDDKPAILIVMHPSHNPNKTIRDSEAEVTDPNIHLTVDCLVYNNDFLDCNYNDNAWHKIHEFFQVSKIVPRKKWWFSWLIVSGVSVCVIVVVVLGIYYGMRKD